MKHLTPLLLLSALLAVACGPKKTAQTPSAEDFAPYIKAYTGGIVANDAVIRIDLMEDAKDMPTEGLFSLSPSVKGEVLWSSASSVSFIPEELEAGKSYNVKFKLGAVHPDAPEFFIFSITVKGAPVQETAKEEEDNGQKFRVVRADAFSDRVEIILNSEPANAKVKGMVELSGAARSYVQVKDSLLTVHFENAKENVELTLDKSLKDNDGNTLGESFVRTFRVADEKPAIEIPLKGNILPDKQALILPFRAVNLGAVEVRVVKIYESNVLSFLQENDLGENSGIRRCGRLVYKGDVALDASKDLRKWNTHSIDLSGMFKQEPGAIYRIRLSFRQDQSLWGGKEYLRRADAPDGKPTAADEAVWDTPNPYYWDNDYDWSEYDWRESDDPSKPSYYMDSSRFPAIELIASDLGLMAQYSGTDQLWITTTDLISAAPLSGVNVEVFDYQLQSLAQGSTDSKGFTQFTLARKPFAVVAKAGGSTAYLKIVSGNQRSLSRFDVGGETVQQGLKAYIYGERGVWRPGDTLHVNAIVAQRGKSLPEGHPATLEVYTPAGQFYSKIVRKGTDGFYSFDIPTKADDPTGYWNAYLKVGGSSFHKTLHIETIKPNRLKITTSINDEEVLQAGKPLKVKVGASWLTGSPAGGNKARAQLTLRSVKSSSFKGFEKYTFTNPSSKFAKAESELYQTTLDASGNAVVDVKLPAAEDAPGMLQASIMTSVEENGGDESFTTVSVPYSPYSSYVGIKVPEGEYLETDKDQPVSIAVVNANGKRVGDHKVDYAVMKLSWNWWWESPGDGDLESYVNGGAANLLKKGTLSSSASSDATFNIRVDYPDWGRYLILAYDKTSGHVSGTFVTIDWPEYRGRASRRDPESITTISFSTDKPSYKVGEKATVYVPAAKGGKALVSLENAGGVISREWVDTGAEDVPFKFDVTPEMAPNFYVHLTLIQPYGNSVNDLPIRMYGVQRVSVENPESHLNPVVNTPKVIHPEEEFTITVSESAGRPMTYTLAIVDEGLLDLTAFKTPDPWQKIYTQEALGVNTWDMFDQVIGAFGTKFSPIAAIGGDQDAILSARKDNRFNPVVMCLPPKTIKKGGKDVLKLKLPMYVGSVRVMVVAGHDGAYGNAEKAVPVQNPLMVVTTLPRILGVEEAVEVPVNVFAMEDNVKEATVSIKADGPVSITGPASQKLSFDGKGDKMAKFSIKGSGEGVSHISVSASASGHKASETIALTVQNPYPEVTQVSRFSLAKGESREVAGGTRLELASFPALNAHSLYLDMKNYPYNCAEQISARGITALYLLPLLSEDEQKEAKDFIQGLIEQLYARQTRAGGFSYWGGDKANSWVSSMAGQFLTMASKEGFKVNSGVLKSWKSYQHKMSKAFRLTGEEVFTTLDECYRLYTLALANEPSLAAMNRIRESGKIDSRSRWMLASTYAICGKTSLADALLDGIGKDFPDYTPYNITYGSSYRDRMIAIETLSLTGRMADAITLAGELVPTGALSTQESAFAAVAYRALYDKVSSSAINVELAGKTIESAKSAVSANVSKDSKLVNKADGTVFCTVLSTSRKARANAVSNGLKLEVKYLSEDGKALNPASIAQGTRFTATIKVTNTSAARALESLALSYNLPSGWEILNDRMADAGADTSYDHMDIRDTRADWFFALPEGRHKTFTLKLRAAYEGSYVMPACVCSAMYEPAINAATADGKAVVTR